MNMKRTKAPADERSCDRRPPEKTQTCHTQRESPKITSSDYGYPIPLEHVTITVIESFFHHSRNDFCENHSSTLFSTPKDIAQRLFSFVVHSFISDLSPDNVQPRRSIHTIRKPSTAEHIAMRSTLYFASIFSLSSGIRLGTDLQSVSSSLPELVVTCLEM